MSNQQPKEELKKIQHAVTIQEGKDIRSLNDLLTNGWYVVNSVPVASGAALLILETMGSDETINNLRELLGYQDQEQQ